MTAESPDWSDAQLVALRQEQLFQKAPAHELEKVPYSFRYEFLCDDDLCPGHKLSCTDWEMGEAYRKWRHSYKAAWEGKFRQRFEEDMITRFDTHFYVGTVHRYPQTWIICGLFYPPRASQKEPPLFPWA